jgi:hypothetical protein
MKDKKLWNELIRLLSVEGQATNAVLAQTCMGVHFIRSLSDIIFAMLYLLKPPKDCNILPVVRGPQFEKHWSKPWSWSFFKLCCKFGKCIEITQDVFRYCINSEEISTFAAKDLQPRTRTLTVYVLRCFLIYIKKANTFCVH